MHTSAKFQGGERFRTHLSQHRGGASQKTFFRPYVEEVGLVVKKALCDCKGYEAAADNKTHRSYFGGIVSHHIEWLQYGKTFENVAMCHAPSHFEWIFR